MAASPNVCKIRAVNRKVGIVPGKATCPITRRNQVLAGRLCDELSVESEETAKGLDPEVNSKAHQRDGVVLLGSHAVLAGEQN